MNKKQPLKSPVLLDKNHLVDSFDCGIEALNDYLIKYAYTNNKNSSSRTYVSCRDNRVVAYYTITPGSVTKQDVPSRVGKGLASHPVPVIILARLAVDISEHGSGIGRSLLQNALIRIINAVDIIGGRAVLVHAKNKSAKSFYLKYGFEESPIDSFHLYLLVKDIKKTLEI